MPLPLRRLLFCLALSSLGLSARAEITLYAFQPAAAAAVEALNARPAHEKYVLASSPLPGKFTVPRFRKPLNLSKILKDAPVARTSVAMIINKAGTVVDAAALNFNNAEFADAIVRAIPQMIGWVPNQTKKNERALIILTFNTRSEDPEEFVVGPINSR